MDDKKQELLKEALRDSDKFFHGNPAEVLQNTQLSKKDKICILRNWILDMELQEIAQEENMPGLKKDILFQLKEALRTLITTPDLDSTQTTKFGKI